MTGIEETETPAATKRIDTEVAIRTGIGIKAAETLATVWSEVVMTWIGIQEVAAVGDSTETESGTEIMVGLQEAIDDNHSRVTAHIHA